MASCVSFLAMFLVFWLSVALAVSPSNSPICTSKKFRNNKVFSNCTNLPVLNSRLYFTYDSVNSSLSIAFVATPPKPDGWIAWAINPTGTGMVGSQALIGFKSNGSVVAMTCNVSGYGPLHESKLSFDVWDLSAESDDENIVIFATAKVPEKAQRLNQVWQVGPSVTNGRPDKHEMNDANMNSKGVLELVGAATSPPPAPAPAPTPASESPTDHHKSAGYISRIGKFDVIWLVGWSVLFGTSF